MVMVGARGRRAGAPGDGEARPAEGEEGCWSAMARSCGLLEADDGGGAEQTIRACRADSEATARLCRDYICWPAWPIVA